MKGTEAFRLIVVRRGEQGELFDAAGSNYRYTIIASNRAESAAATMDWYCRRGETSENRIKGAPGDRRGVGGESSLH
jgi:hypothetical protein